jgi:hypothetical protein
MTLKCPSKIGFAMLQQELIRMTKSSKKLLTMVKRSLVHPGDPGLANNRRQAVQQS